jgi:hypothetical protein
VALATVAARLADFDETCMCQLPECFSDGRARYAEALGEHVLIETKARLKFTDSIEVAIWSASLSAWVLDSGSAAFMGKSPFASSLCTQQTTWACKTATCMQDIKNCTQYKTRRDSR